MHDTKSIYITETAVSATDLEIGEKFYIFLYRPGRSTALKLVEIHLPTSTPDVSPKLSLRK